MPMIRWPLAGLFALILIATASPALAKKTKHTRPAAEGCYSAAEFDADRLLELHTELMVIGLKCQSAYPVERPFDAYNAFTRQHREMLSEAERRMIAYFRRQGGNGTRAFDTFRTELANDVSRHARLLGETGYCAVMVPLAVQTPALSEEAVLKLLTDEATPHFARKPPCVAAGGHPPAGAAKIQ